MANEPRPWGSDTAITWIHLSDFYAGKLEESGWPQVEVELERSIREMQERLGTPDLVIFSGDLANRGAEDEYEIVDRFLNRLEGWLEQELPILAVPGNHDLLRPSTDSTQYASLEYYENNSGVHDSIWRGDARVFDGLFPNYSAWADRRVLRSLHRANIEFHVSPRVPGDFSAVLEKEGSQFGFVGLNSAWMQTSGKDFYGRLQLPAEQFHAALPPPTSGNPLDWFREVDQAILLTHHPRTWLSEKALAIYNREIHTPGRFALALSGHMHRERKAVRADPTVDEMDRLFFQSPPLRDLGRDGAPGSTSCGYAWGSITAGGEVRIWPQRLAYERDGSRSFEPGPPTVRQMTSQKTFGIEAPRPSVDQSKQRKDFVTDEIPNHRIIEELANVLTDPDEAMMLARDFGVPPSRLPRFTTANTFWTKVVKDAHNGMLMGGVGQIVAGAAKHFPYNPIFARYARDSQDPEPTPSDVAPPSPPDDSAPYQPSDTAQQASTSTQDVAPRSPDQERFPTPPLPAPETRNEPPADTRPQPEIASANETARDEHPPAAPTLPESRSESEPARQTPPRESPTQVQHNAVLDLEISKDHVKLTVRGAEEPIYESPLAENLDPKRKCFAKKTGDDSLVDLKYAKQALTSIWGKPMVFAFGDQLAQMLFGSSIPEGVRDALVVPPGEARRLVLHTDPTAAVFPWEYLRIEERFIAQRRISIVRHVDTTHEFGGLSIPQLDTVHLISGKPEEGDELRTHEVRIREAIAPKIKPVSRDEVTLEKLDEILDQGHPAGLHFLGHGDEGAGDPVLRLMPSGGRDGRISAEVFAARLQDKNVHLVFLGACWSGASTNTEQLGIAAEVVRVTGIPVVAMQQAVQQQFSTEFATEFYSALQRHELDIEKAVYDARLRTTAGRTNLGIPVVFADTNKDSAVRELPATEVQAPIEFRVLAISREDARDVAKRSTHAAVIDKALESKPEAVAVEKPGEGPRNMLRWTKAILDLARNDAGGDVEQARNEVIESMRPVLPSLGKITRVDTESDDDFVVEWDQLNQQIREVQRDLSIGSDVLRRIAGELGAGRHVVLVGPTGTGKTTVARKLVRALNYYPFVVTASADWSTFETVGGFWPQPRDEGGFDLSFKNGVVLEAILHNWTEHSRGGKSRWRRTPRPDPDDDTSDVRGYWLVLDELNRADMDRALGALFTALETRRLRVPVKSKGAGDHATNEIPIPRDFRIIATLNNMDRHYLFRLSDALKRRFAFVEVPVTKALDKEWVSLCMQSGVVSEEPVHDDLRRFVVLARAWHPVGSAQLLSALRFLKSSQDAGMNYGSRLHQAIAGSIMPSLEEADRGVLQVLRTWATDPAKTGDAAKAIEADLLDRDSMAAWLASWHDDVDEQTDPLAELLRLTTRDSGHALPDLAKHLEAMVRDFSDV